ncbi:hypothetical protein SMNI109538_15445 [Smaragdicoccus niigatensis]
MAIFRRWYGQPEKHQTGRFGLPSCGLTATSPQTDLYKEPRLWFPVPAGIQDKGASFACHIHPPSDSSRPNVRCIGPLHRRTRGRTSTPTRTRPGHHRGGRSTGCRRAGIRATPTTAETGLRTAETRVRPATSTCLRATGHSGGSASGRSGSGDSRARGSGCSETSRGCRHSKASGSRSSTCGSGCSETSGSGQHSEARGSRSSARGSRRCQASGCGCDRSGPQGASRSSRRT